MDCQLDLFSGHTTPEKTCEVNVTVADGLAESAPAATAQAGLTVAPARTNGGPKTLADACDAYSDAASEHPRRVKYRSAMKMFGKVVGLPLNQISTEPAKLTALAKKALPMSAGVKPRRWGELRSDVRCGLAALGSDIAPARDDTALSDAWRVLVDALPEDRQKIGLSRFTRFMSRTAIDPSAVTPQTLQVFEAELTQRGFGVEVGRAIRQTAKLFNQAGRLVEGWPQVQLPITADPRRYSLEKGALPPSLWLASEAFLQAKATADAFSDDYTRPVRERTTKGRRLTIHMLASALVLSGKLPAEQVTDLEVLTRIDNVKAIFAWYRARNGGTLTTSHNNSLWLLKTISKHWLKDAARAEQLGRFIANLSEEIGDTSGLKPRNRERLMQLESPANRRKLFKLPDKILREVERSQIPSHGEAVRLMRGLQVGILSFVPIRIKNLTELQIGANLIVRGTGKYRQMWIFLPAAITKTKVDYNAPLPAQLYPLIDAWLNTYRPLIHLGPSLYLFPNPSGGLRNTSGTSQEFRKFLERETGLVMNPHLFRHMAAMLILQNDPGALEYVRQLLGHRSTVTTLRAYAELQTRGAFENYQVNILEIVDGAPIRKVKGSRS